MTEKKVVILSSKDPDETPHDKTSKMGVLCMNAVVISLGRVSEFVHKLLGATHRVVYSVKTVKAVLY